MTNYHNVKKFLKIPAATKLIIRKHFIAIERFWPFYNVILKSHTKVWKHSVTIKHFLYCHCLQFVLRFKKYSIPLCWNFVKEFIY